MSQHYLNPRQKRHLRSLAHKLKPVVMIGAAGLSEAVARTIEEELSNHELIKVRVRSDDPAERETIIEALSQDFEAGLVQRMGHIVTLYRPHPEKPRIQFP